MIISRKAYKEALTLYQQWMEEDAAEIETLRERVAYLESERETIRQASIANADADKPITELTLAEIPTHVCGPDEHDEDIARWEGEGGAIVTDWNKD